MSYQATRTAWRNGDRRFRRWPWLSRRRTVLSVPKNALVRSADTHGKTVPTRKSAVFAVVGFFIPLWFFYHPYFIITRLWSGSADDNIRNRARIVGILWILSNPIFGFLPLLGWQIMMWLRWGAFLHSSSLATST